MSNHLSASQRTILALQQRVAELEQMQREYNAFLNYVIANNGIEELGGTRFYTIEMELMKQLELLPIRSEAVDNNKRLELRRISQPLSNHPIITLPS